MLPYLWQNASKVAVKNSLSNAQCNVRPHGGKRATELLHCFVVDVSTHNRRSKS